jgi:hypothetical protein
MHMLKCEICEKKYTELYEEIVIYTPVRQP